MDWIRLNLEDNPAQKHKANQMKSAIQKFWWLPILVLVVASAGFVIWALTPLGPMPEAREALQSNAQVQVESGDWWLFRPTRIQPVGGAIIYPGGRVDPRSYAPEAQALAEQGYLAVIVPMPLNLAVFAPQKARQVIAAYPEIQDWAIGGHSLGGAMAANFVHANPSQVKGLFLWAAYPAASDNLSGFDLAVVSIYGTLDGLATMDKISTSRPLLPADTRWVEIEGGNHAQFGWYGPQPGDNSATISRQDQQTQIIDATAALLFEISR
jgi:dienelactone hydrolase